MARGRHSHLWRVAQPVSIAYVPIDSVCSFLGKVIVHGRSGSVAFPRTNVTPARPACLAVELTELARSAERSAVERSRVEDMIETKPIDELVLDRAECRRELSLRLDGMALRLRWDTGRRRCSSCTSVMISSGIAVHMRKCAAVALQRRRRRVSMRLEWAQATLARAMAASSTTTGTSSPHHNHPTRSGDWCGKIMLSSSCSHSWAE
jgi:hypothetical protein